MKGTRLDRYVLGDPIGSGGMAVVYLAHDTLLDREVAIKVMHPHLTGKEESRRRFSLEAQAVARLRHPSILEIFDFSGSESEELFIVTELVRGKTLRAFGEEVGFFLPEIAALIAAELCDALEHAHAQGVIHRDLKPENVMVREDGALKLMDFGIARMVGTDERMTLTGALMGSPHHMAPEIIEGSEAGIASDIFSLGTILYWMITGETAFEGNNPTHTLRRILESDYRDPRAIRPGCPATLADVVATSLRRDPQDRFASAAEMRAALSATLSEVGIDSRREELASFFQDPPGHAALLETRLRESLLRSTREAIESGKHARALALLDRLLSLDPEDEEARELLLRLRRWSQRKTWGLRAAGISFVGLLAAGVFALRGGPPEEAPVEPPQDVGPVAHLPITPEKVEEPIRRADPPPSPRPRPRAVQPVETQAPAPEVEEETLERETRMVHLRWVPQGAILYLDGKRMETLAPNWMGELEVGTHRVALLHSSCCRPYEEVLEVEAGEEPIRRSIVLEPKESGWFEVVCEEPDAEVWLDGSFRGTVAEVQKRGGVAVAFSKDDQGRERYVKEIQFDLLPPQGATWPPLQGEVVVRAGQRTRSAPLACAGNPGK